MTTVDPVWESTVATLTSWAAPDPDQSALRHAVLAFLDARPDGCQRSCVPGHITASTLVVDHTGSQVLLTLHPRLGRWVQLGGHCEPGDPDIVDAALRAHPVVWTAGGTPHTVMPLGFEELVALTDGTVAIVSAD